MWRIANRLSPQVSSSRLRILKNILGISSFILFSYNSPQARAKDLSFADFPFLVSCEVSGVVRAFYLSRIGEDGVAVYISPDSSAGTVTINGVAKPALGGEGPGNCSGKTLQELKSAGQAFYLQH